MSNRLYQGIIFQMKDAIDRTIGVVNQDGTVICSSNLNLIGETNYVDFSKIVNLDPIIIDSRTFLMIGNAPHPDCAVFVDGDDKSAADYAKLISIALNNIDQLYAEKHDKNNFIKNVITNNILPGDIYLKARELGISNEAFRCVLLVRADNKYEASISEAVSQLFPDKNKDLVIALSEYDTVLVKEVREDTSMKDLENLARSIADTLTSDYYVSCQIGIGSIIVGVKDLPSSFKNSQIALEVSKVFDTEKTIITYEALGIARLIYQLPNVICESFLNEIFKKGSISGLDQETLFTIQKFFENNLNVSETSRKLFVHRNTLVYRLEKIKKLTGLDLREFDDAIVFKVALMVKKYIDAKPTKF